VRGFCAAHPGKKVGIVNFDAHFDVRAMEHGPHNGASM
jgi:arginase family enzyme